jgi:hypothetical protein
VECLRTDSGFAAVARAGWKSATANKSFLLLFFKKEDSFFLIDDYQK